MIVSPRLAWMLVLAAACGHHAQDHSGAGSAVAGGSGSAVAAGSGSAVAAGSAAAAYPEVLASQPPRVTLATAGAEPRRAFAFAPTAGDRTVALTMSSGSADMPKDERLGVALTLAWTTPANGAKPYEFRVKESKAIAPNDAKDGEAAIIGAVGAMYSSVGGRVDADAHGRATIVRTTATLPTRPSLLWILHPLIVPLPVEQIGVGAAWTTTQTLTMDGANGSAERRYELAAIAGDALTINVTGSTRWSTGTGSDDVAFVETIAGTLVVKPTDVLAQSGHVTSTQDLGVGKGAVEITIAP